MDETPASTDAAGENGMQWYVLKVQSNREKSIRESLLRRIKREGLEVCFGEIVIPTETDSQPPCPAGPVGSVPFGELSSFCGFSGVGGSRNG